MNEIQVFRHTAPSLLEALVALEDVFGEELLRKTSFVSEEEELITVFLDELHLLAAMVADSSDLSVPTGLEKLHISVENVGYRGKVCATYVFDSTVTPFSGVRIILDERDLDEVVAELRAPEEVLTVGMANKLRKAGWKNIARVEELEHEPADEEHVIEPADESEIEEEDMPEASAVHDAERSDDLGPPPWSYEDLQELRTVEDGECFFSPRSPELGVCRLKKAYAYGTCHVTCLNEEYNKIACTLNYNNASYFPLDGDLRVLPIKMGKTDEGALRYIVALTQQARRALHADVEEPEREVKPALQLS